MEPLDLNEWADIRMLKCKSDSPAFGQTTFRVEVFKVTAEGLYGKPIAKPCCPTMFYPSFAWKEISS